MNKFIQNNKGFTIIEVLISGVVFIIGFTLLVSLLQNIFVKFSAKELKLGSNIAKQLMIETVVNQKTESLDTLITISGVTYMARKRVIVESKIAKVSISVKRAKKNNEIIELYNELYIP